MSNNVHSDFCCMRLGNVVVVVERGAGAPHRSSRSAGYGSST